MNNTNSDINLYSISDIDNFLKKDKSIIKYTLSDAILFLLFADTDPIKGKIRQMKEIFLLLNEILRHQQVQQINFEKKRYGPYSEEVEYTIDQLVYSNYISIRGKKITNDFAIQITPKGIGYIKNKFNELPKEIQQSIKRKRIEWDTHIPSGLLNIVYTHYDEYLENSVLKRRYEKIDWSNENQKKE